MNTQSDLFGKSAERTCSTCGSVMREFDHAFLCLVCDNRITKRTPKAHARQTDPETSHEAAGSLDGTAIRDSQRGVLRLFETFGPMTDEEMVARAQVCGIKQSRSGLRTRRNELTNDFEPPLIRDSGERKRTESGRNAIIWRVGRP